MLLAFISTTILGAHYFVRCQAARVAHELDAMYPESTQKEYSQCSVFSRDDSLGVVWNFGIDRTDGSCYAKCLGEGLYNSERRHHALATAYRADWEANACHCRDKVTKKDLLPQFFRSDQCHPETCWEMFSHFAGMYEKVNKFKVGSSCQVCYTNREPFCDGVTIGKSFSPVEIKDNLDDLPDWVVDLDLDIPGMDVPSVTTPPTEEVECPNSVRVDDWLDCYDAATQKVVPAECCLDKYTLEHTGGDSSVEHTEHVEKLEEDSGDKPTGAPEPHLFKPVELDEHGIVFVVDVSASMDEEYCHQDQCGTRLEFLQSELTYAISGLHAEEQSFNIIAFSHRTWLMSTHGLVPATSRNKKLAAAWISRLFSGGGTDIKRPLSQALSLAGVDSVQVLTDGAPVGRGVCKSASCMPQGIIPVHTILFMPGESEHGTQARELLQAISAESGGIFKEPFK